MCFIEIWYLWYIYIYYTKFNYTLCKFYPLRSFDYSWNNDLIVLLCKRNICFILENFVLLLNHFLVISTANIRKVVSMLFCQHWSNQQTQLSLSTKYKSWNNIDLSTLNQRCFANVESTSINVRFFQLSFSTKCQRRNNVDERWPSTLFQRWINVNVFAG